MPGLGGVRGAEAGGAGSGLFFFFFRWLLDGRGVSGIAEGVGGSDEVGAGDGGLCSGEGLGVVKWGWGGHCEVWGEVQSVEWGYLLSTRARDVCLDMYSNQPPKIIHVRQIA